MKKKNIIGIIILTIGIIFLTLGIFFPLRNQVNNDNNTDSDNNQVENIVINITNFNIDTSTKDKLKLSFELENKSNISIKDKRLTIEFYEKDRVIYIFEYYINNLLKEETILIEENLEFSYQEITKYKAFIENKIIEII